ncbi:hypothetical protein B0H17DRAFT_1084364 [Mycena rosella]|uniref:DUF7330 domain-containing protein n=1 Tax=Mycena rosella TaxID=1033263 RepID=A0AAD7GAD4_MYCRO|nr:hypothetical protein B0H17DRAFT_1084364 [Mycena rosella]
MRWLASNKESPIAGAARLPYSAEVSLDLPLPSATLMFFSKGALSAGDLNITTSAELTDVARINIAVHYVATAVRDTTKVCFLKRKAGETGVGIFTPQQWWDRRQTDRLYFEVELILPRGSYINGLATDVNNLSQDLDNLKDIITFGSIFLQGSNGPIHAKALGAANATLQTSNGEVSLDYLVALNAVVSSNNNGISGNYQVSESLDLTTSNGPIEVTVGINGSETPKSLSMHTSNSAIDAVVNLDTTSGRGGNFLVKADTSNGRLTTRIASAPLDSVLNLQAETSNSPGSVTLPLTYEGSLTMHTSNAPSFIWRVDRIEQDPACKAHSDCKGRTRTIGTHMVANGKAEGAVYWERKNANRGNVTLQSSNGAVSFYV